MPELACHPATPCDAVRRIDVDVLVSRRQVAFRYVLEGRTQGLRIPPEAVAARTDGLWQHTCCEAFLGGTGLAGYRELNFSPSTAWAAWSFTGYRAGMQPLPVAEPPRIHARVTERTLEVTAVVVRSLLPAALDQTTFGLAAVVEETTGQVSYWALSHPSARPDFHDAAGFRPAIARETRDAP